MIGKEVQLQPLNVDNLAGEQELPLDEREFHHHLRKLALDVLLQSDQLAVVGFPAAIAVGAFLLHLFSPVSELPPQLEHSRGLQLP